MLIILNNEKEKLPPVQQTIHYDLKDPESKKLKNKRELGRKVNKGHIKQKHIESEKEGLKTGNPIAFEEFDLKPGVSLYYMGISKHGNKPVNTIDRLMNPDVRLTKTEYLELTKGGNLSRGNLPSISEREINTAYEIRPKEADFLSKVVKTDGFKDLPKPSMKEGIIDTTGTIRVSSSKLLNTLSEIGSKDRTTARRLSKRDKNKNDLEGEMDEIDRFNKELILSKDWGNSAYQGTFLKPRTLKSKPSPRDIKSSIGQRLKLPRERVIESKRPSSYKHLPPPMPGQPVGTQFLPDIAAVNESRERSFFN